MGWKSKSRVEFKGVEKCRWGCISKSRGFRMDWELAGRRSEEIQSGSDEMDLT